MNGSCAPRARVRCLFLYAAPPFLPALLPEGSVCTFYTLAPLLFTTPFSAFRRAECRYLAFAAAAPFYAHRLSLPGKEGTAETAVPLPASCLPASLLARAHLRTCAHPRIILRATFFTPALTAFLPRLFLRCCRTYWLLLRTPRGGGGLLYAPLMHAPLPSLRTRVPLLLPRSAACHWRKTFALLRLWFAVRDSRWFGGLFCRAQRASLRACHALPLRHCCG